MTDFLVGTASWTDSTLVKSDLFYPPTAKTAAERLAFYAAQFPTVEVDSSYYALPSERNAELWAERTPAGFIFNIKAFGWLTQHPAETARLPKAIKEILPESMGVAARIKTPPRPALELAFQMFWSALQPLRAAGKLGYLLFQFPPYVTFRPSNFDYIATLRERMPARQSRWSSAIRAGSAGSQRARRRSASCVITDSHWSRSMLLLRSACRRYSKLRLMTFTSGFMAGIARIGTNITAVRPSVSNISTRNASWANGPAASNGRTAGSSVLS